MKQMLIALTAIAVVAVPASAAPVVGKAYDAKTTPHMYIVNKAGTLVYAGGIDDKPTPFPADVNGARNHVLAALAEMKAGKPVSVATSRPYGCAVKYKDS